MQQELFRRGGKRAGAGRKPKNGRAGVSHSRREEVRASWPVHVTLRVARELYLRKRSIWRAIAKATMAASGAIRVVHASAQHDHLHILVEASGRAALTKGMLAFQVSAAHWINRAAQRSGRVFVDRYHTHIIKTPREARSAIKYVLSNWRKHGEDAHLRCAIDPFSTGYAFWTTERAPRDYEPLPTAEPGSWLLRTGWQRAGAISPFEKPGVSRRSRCGSRR